MILLQPLIAFTLVLSPLIGQIYAPTVVRSLLMRTLLCPPHGLSSILLKVPFIGLSHIWILNLLLFRMFFLRMDSKEDFMNLFSGNFETFSNTLDPSVCWSEHIHRPTKRFMEDSLFGCLAFMQTQFQCINFCTKACCKLSSIALQLGHNEFTHRLDDGTINYMDTCAFHATLADNDTYFMARQWTSLIIPALLRQWWRKLMIFWQWCVAALMTLCIRSNSTH